MTHPRRRRENNVYICVNMLSRASPGGDAEPGLLVYGPVDGVCPGNLLEALGVSPSRHRELRREC
jgi:hypothetical protein